MEKNISREKRFLLKGGTFTLIQNSLANLSIYFLSLLLLLVLIKKDDNVDARISLSNHERMKKMNRSLGTVLLDQRNSVAWE